MAAGDDDARRAAGGYHRSHQPLGRDYRDRGLAAIARIRADLNRRIAAHSPETPEPDETIDPDE